VIGQHNGIHNFTIGQRKRLGFAPANLFTSLDRSGENRVVSARRCPPKAACGGRRRELDFLRKPSAQIRAFDKIRHKHEPAPATHRALERHQAKVHVATPPQRAITPGQAAVFYKGRRRPRRRVALAERSRLASRLGGGGGGTFEVL